MTKAIIDGDIVAYRCAAACENEDEYTAILTARTKIDEILFETYADSHVVFFSDTRTNGWRRVLNPEYKANRTQPSPRYLEACINYISENFNTEVMDMAEADDLLGCAQTKDTVLVTIDKDLLQVVGNHYNFVKKEFQQVGPHAAYFNFWKQMIVGDSTDNIVGVRGLGEKKATKLLENSPSNEWHYMVRELYDDELRFIINYNLLRVWRNPYEFYDGEKITVYKNKEELELSLNRVREQLERLEKAVAEAKQKQQEEENRQLELNL